MSRVWHAGAEIDVAGATNDPDGASGGSAAVTRDTVTFRSGLAAWKCDSGAGNSQGSINHGQPQLPTTSVTYFWRAYFNASAAPSAATTILGIGSTNGGAVLRTDGKVELLSVFGVSGGSSPGLVADGNWHRVELKVIYDGSGQVTDYDLRVDGQSIGTLTGRADGAGSVVQFGWIGTPGANKVIYVDDVAVNNSSGAVNNSWCGDGAVVLLKPVADSAVGASWTRDNASAASLFSAFQYPPAGIADTAASTGLHQIRNAGANTSYDAQLGAYSDSVASGGGGMKALDIVNAVIPVVTAGAPVSTGAKSGSFGIVSNPAITNRVFTGGTGTATFFWGGAAPGTYGSNWRWEVGTLTEAPSVTLATKPVARLTITGGTTTRIAMSCAIGLYVEFTPSKSLAHSPRRRNLVVR